MVRLFKAEPAALLGAVQAVVALLVSFGLHLSPEQTGSIMALAAAVVALIVRSQVAPSTPVVSPPVVDPTDDSQPAAS